MGPVLGRPADGASRQRGPDTTGLAIAGLPDARNTAHLAKTAAARMKRTGWDRRWRPQATPTPARLPMRKTKPQGLSGGCPKKAAHLAA